ncbi:hypothetical protein [Dactylosporangium sp. CA-233914]|uniref:hypothetical protein n=1 Tax=Dactylosporangium sp. CA-233914 TaxID=3239934 RepID=UPI003D90F7E4
MTTRARRALHRLGEQCRALLGPAAEAIRRRRYERLWSGPAAALSVAGLAVAARTGPGHTFIAGYAITHPGDPLPATLARLPLSLFAPAALLPYWFAMLQVLVVFSAAQALLGLRRTIAVAVLGHGLATLSAPLWVAAGPPLGLDHRYAGLADAGPSAAVVALLAYAAVSRRAVWLAAALVAYHGTEVVIVGGLAPREHLVGTLTGAAAALLAPAGTTEPGGAPP